jgi:hypothetical protein
MFCVHQDIAILVYSGLLLNHLEDQSGTPRELAACYLETHGIKMREDSGSTANQS